MYQPIVHRAMLLPATVLLCAFVQCAAGHTEPARARADAGLLDLRGTDFSKPVALDGQWDFFWQRFLAPGTRNMPAENTIPVPGMWNGRSLRDRGQPVSGDGYATLRLRILLADPVPALALNIPTMHTAHRLYWNGQLLLAAGKPGSDQASTIPRYRPAVVTVPARAGENEIVLHIANFHHAKGGTWTSLILGKAGDLHQAREQAFDIDLLLFATLSVMGAYHLVFFLWRPGERALLFFSVFCIMIALRTICTGEHVLLRYWPSIDWPLYIRLQYASYYAAVPVWAAFVRSMYAAEMPRVYYRVVLLSTILFCASLVLPVQWFSQGMGIFQILTMVFGIGMLPILVRAVRRKRDGAVLFLLGWLLFFATVINDLLYNSELIQSVRLAPVGVFLFVFFQAALLAQRFARSFSTTEQHSLDLERRVRERTHELEESRDALVVARERAEQGSRAKSEFLATMSHEIRTPLNSILGAVDLLQQSPLGQTEREHLRLLSRAGLALLHLVNQTLDFSRIEAGRITLESVPFQPRELVEGLLEVFSLRAREKGLDLRAEFGPDIDEGLTLLGDSARLSQILINLIGNAIKFTAQGAVCVRVTRASDDVNSHGVVLCFEIEDTGIGIPPDQLEQIFESFTQGDSSVTRQYGGTGLGLTIVRRLVELMGGTIYAANAGDQGSVFTFTARFTASTPGAQPQPAGQARATSADSIPALRPGLAVLLADDNEDNRNLFAAYLAPARARLIMAENGADAVAKFQTQHFDVVLMDIQMPVMDGYTAVGRIRAWERAGDRELTPIVALTANATRADQERSLSAGCDAFLTKPLLRRTLYETLARLTNPGEGRGPTAP